MQTRNLIAATGAVLAALSLTTAPAYANGISVHNAAPQYKRDVLALYGPLKQYVHISKTESNNEAKMGRAAVTMAQDFARFGHTLRTQQWPSRYLADIETLEADTTQMRIDMNYAADVATGDETVTSVSSDQFNNDINTWASDGQTVGNDLHVKFPSS